MTAHPDDAERRVKERRSGPHEAVVLQRRLLRLVLGVLIFSMVVGLTTSATALYIALNVQHTNDDIKQANRAIAGQQRRIDANTLTIREAGYQNCVRGNAVRAELQFRADLTPPAVVRRLLKQFGLDPSLIDQTSSEALRSRLPIYDCLPLEHNGPAKPLSTAQQKRYVKEYAAGEKPLIPPAPPQTP